MDTLALEEKLLKYEYDAKFNALNKALLQLVSFTLNVCVPWCSNVVLSCWKILWLALCL